MQPSLSTNSASEKNKASRRRIVISTLALTLVLYFVAVLLISMYKIYSKLDQRAIITPSFQEKKTDQQVVNQLPIKTPESDPSTSSSAALSALKIPPLDSVSDIPVAPIALDTNFIGNSQANSGLAGVNLNLFSTTNAAGMGTATFFNVRQNGRRFVFIIDLSGSIKQIQQETIQRELTKSLQNFGGTSYQVICFTNSAWFLGEKKPVAGKAKKNRPIPTAPWLTRSQTRKSVNQLEELDWGGGTNWVAALDAALAMNPKPEIIYFMTDGQGGYGASRLSAEEFAEQYGGAFLKNRIGLVSIGLVNEAAAESLRDLSEKAKGKLILAKEDGTTEVIADFSR